MKFVFHTQPRTQIFNRWLSWLDISKAWTILRMKTKFFKDFFRHDKIFFATSKLFVEISWIIFCSNLRLEFSRKQLEYFRICYCNSETFSVTSWTVKSHLLQRQFDWNKRRSKNYLYKWDFYESETINKNWQFQRQKRKWGILTRNENE